MDCVLKKREIKTMYHEKELIMKNYKWIIFTMVAMVLSGLTSAAHAQSPAVLLEKGIYLEETAGELDEAMVVYQQILDDNDANRVFVAKAAYQLGKCYLKKGDKTKAQSFFRDVTIQYSDQRAITARASRELQKLGKEAGGAPIVIATTPATYANNVPVDTKEITVTFNQAMRDGSWSWCRGDIAFPKITGKIRYDKTKTKCILPVSLEAGKVYWLRINSQNYQSFMNIQGVSAKNYVILFATRGVDGSPTAIPNNLLKKAQAINNSQNTVASIDSGKSLFELLPSGVISFIGGKYGSTCAEAAINNLYSNSHIYFVDSDFILHKGGMGYYYNNTLEPKSNRIRLSRTSRPNQTLYDVAGRKMNVDIVPDNSRRGFYHIYWTPDEPIPPMQFFSYGWANNDSKTLHSMPDSSDYHVTMQNHFGSHAIETFFLVLPHGVSLASQSEDYTEKMTIGDCDIYYWKKEVSADTNNKVSVKLTNESSDSVLVKPTSDADKETSIALSTQGWQLWQQRKMAEAEAKFNEAVAKDPGNANAWNGLGWSQFNQGKPAGAKVAFEKCLELEPTHSAALNGLGWIAHGDGDYEEAIRFWETAVETAPGATAALNGLTRTYMELKEYDKAARYYQMWVKVEPNNHDAKAGLIKAQKLSSSASHSQNQHTESIPLDLEPVIFDGEYMRMKITTPVGATIGQVIYTTKNAMVNDKACWRTESYMYIEANNMLQFTRVDIDKDSFTPIFGWTKNNLGDFKAKYNSGSVEYSGTFADSAQTRTIPIDSVVYDNEQVIHVIRSMPLAVGYSRSFNIFPVQSGMVTNCKINVTGIEMADWSGGEIECFAITLSVYMGKRRLLEHQLWISVDQHRWLVKYDSGTAVMKLHGVGKQESGKDRIFRSNYGYGFMLPADWQCAGSTVASQYEESLQLLQPGLIARSSFIVTKRTGIVAERNGRDDVHAIAKQDVTILKGFFTDYTVRENSWQELTIDKVNAVRYVADYVDKGTKMVEYRTYILDDSKVYWFVFRIEKDMFEEYRQTFDDITGSFTFSSSGRGR